MSTARPQNPASVPTTPSPPRSYPSIEPSGALFVAYQLAGKRVLLVGGGQVGASRLYHLLCAGPAEIVLVSPREGLSDETRHYLEWDRPGATTQGEVAHDDDEEDKLGKKRKGVITWKDREYEQGEEARDGPYDLVLTAIDSPGLSTEICHRCRELKVPVNVADVPPECDFYFGSVLRSGSLSVMVSTNGKGPRVAARLRRRLEKAIPEQSGKAIENVGKLRARLRAQVPGKDKATIDRRMDWMSRVCDRWSVAQLARLDDDMIDRVLDGWDRDEARGYWDVNRTQGNGLGYVASWASWVGLGTCPVRNDPDGKASRCPFVVGSTGVLTGVAITIAVAKALEYARRR
ncbi:hypothetical protein JCM10212_006491 [Sporobolomyces blumeae]